MCGGGDPVKHLRGLVVSRTGHVAKAANNKPPEMLILGEARAAIAANAMTICPPTPSKEDAAADADPKGELHDAVTCQECGCVEPEVTHNDGLATCVAFSARVLELDEPGVL